MSTEDFVRSRFRSEVEIDVGDAAAGLTQALAEDDPLSPKSDDPLDYDSIFKIMLIGDSGAGKTALVVRYCDGAFVESHIATVGIDFKRKTVTMPNRKRVKMQIWDTAGQERFRSITHTYYKGAMGMLLVFDVASEASFNSVRAWIDSIKKVMPSPMAL